MDTDPQARTPDVDPQPLTDATTERDAEPRPQLDPDAVPNIVLHPGDTVTVEAHYPDDATLYLIARGGQCYAVLDCDYNRRDEYSIRAIRYVGDGGGVLPVRAQPEPVPLDGTISVVGPVDGPYAYAVAHSHHHAHGTGDGDVLTHAHKHEHVGPEASRANQLGHTADVHDHQH